MNTDWLEKVFSHPELMMMGHGQRLEDRNLGLGWLYYALVRLLRPRTAICIGSWRGFVPIILGQGLKDNNEGGKVVFIDPSMVDDHWTDSNRTQAWFAELGQDNIQHYRMTTQEFLISDAFKNLGSVDLLFVDGFHSEEQARFDHEAFEPLLSEGAMILFHDSVRKITSYMYGPEKHYEHTVVDYIDKLKLRDDLQVMDFSCDQGVTLVQRVVAPTC